MKRAIKTVFLFLAMFCLLTVSTASVLFAADGTSITIKLPVSQVFTKTGTDADVNDEFQYRLTASDPASPLPEGAKDGSFDFSMKGTSDTDVSLTYVHAGEYLYEVKQVVTEKATGYTYDEAVYTLKVYIKNTDNDGLTAEVILQNEDNDKSAKAVFTNSYEPSPTKPEDMSDPPIKKTVTGSPSKSSVFTFTLTAADKSYPMPSGSKDGVKTVTITGSGETEFGTWSYTAAGTYTYTVKEVNTGESGYTYDTTIYTIKDVVKDNNGVLKAERSITDANGKTSGVLAYTNKYTSAATPTSTPTTGTTTTVVNKTVTVNGTTGTATSGPKTGDSGINPVLFYVFGIAVLTAVGCVVYFAVIGKKRKNRDEKEN